MALAGMWLGLFGLVGALFALDLSPWPRPLTTWRRRHPHRWAAVMAVLVTCLAGLALTFGPKDSAEHYLTGLVIETILTLDQIFITLMVLQHAKIPDIHWPKFVRLTVLANLMLRLAGLSVWDGLTGWMPWLIYAGAVLMIFLGVRLLFACSKGQTFVPDLGEDPRIRFLKRRFPQAGCPNNPHLVGCDPDPVTGLPRRGLTPFGVCFGFILWASLILSADSVVVTFAVTQDLWTALLINAGALILIRPLFMSLRHHSGRFETFRPSLGLMLVFLGAQVFAGLSLAGLSPSQVSLAVILGLSCLGLVAYGLRQRPKPS
ncbi:MAG: TerC family protein [Asticcacaulis sp.]